MPSTKTDYRQMSADQLSALTLNELPTACWAILQEGVEQRKSPLHTPVLATLRNQQPEARVVVLRAADEHDRTLDCHTDRRTQKTSQIDNHSTVSWVFYDVDRKLQLRARGTARVLTSAIDTDERWSSMGDYSRLCYAQPTAPGQIVDEIVNATPSPNVDDVNAGRHQFAIVRSDIIEIEWLYLLQTGHRRAVIRWENDEPIANWIMP